MAQNLTYYYISSTAVYFDNSTDLTETIYQNVSLADKRAFHQQFLQHPNTAEYNDTGADVRNHQRGSFLLVVDSE